MKNKYVIRCRISEKKFRAILRLFCLDIKACKVAQITGISRPATNRLYTQIRHHIAEQCELVSPFDEGAGERTFKTRSYLQAATNSSLVTPACLSKLAKAPILTSR
ncbi:hypothetical protein [Candidatus Spongiihabitans sp.]|uniref:hypothetical protein n=1 Tax=Candidatus Spongiihabitans sp. TaxID=3101308 RepID=UPI003C7B1CA8